MIPKGAFICVYQDMGYKIIEKFVAEVGHEQCGFKDALGRVTPFGEGGASDLFSNP